METTVEEESVPQPDHAPEAVAVEGWRPILNPEQQRAYESSCNYILMHGEKGSGKSTGGIHALIRHCYDEYGALAMVIAPAIRTGKEGVFYELERALDVWKNGNLDFEGNRLDDGIGLDYTEASLDPNTKDRVLYIGNKHGGWSKVMLVSMPYAAVVARRMKGLSPSFVYVDEITEMEDATYFTYVILQLGRRKDIVGPQQYYASCNPDGPSHWVYKVFFEDCVDEHGRLDPNYLVLNIPLTENLHNLPKGYLERLQALKDPVERARLFEGRWVDRPSGEAIFKNYYRPAIHLRGDRVRNVGLQPHRQLPIFVGYDPGPANYSIVFLQMIPTRDGKIIWIVFDEMIFVGQHRPDFYVASEVTQRMDYWGRMTQNQCAFVHVADQSAFTHLRSDGEYDATRMKHLTRDRVRMQACPQAKESVIARVAMLRNMFLNETLFISATCPRVEEAMRLLSSEKPKFGKYDDSAGLKPKRSIYIHPFDAMSYPIFFTQLMPGKFAPQTAPTKAAVFRAGRG
jgi:hypothetical protein